MQNLSPVVSGKCSSPYHVCSTIDLRSPWFCDDLNVSQAWYDVSDKCGGEALYQCGLQWLWNPCFS